MNRIGGIDEFLLKLAEVAESAREGSFSRAEHALEAGELFNGAGFFAFEGRGETSAKPDDAPLGEHKLLDQGGFRRADGPVFGEEFRVHVVELLWLSPGMVNFAL